MARFALPNMAYIRNDDGAYAKTLQALSDAINRLSDQCNADPNSTQISAPSPVSSVTVTAADGIHDIRVEDQSPAYRGINYFAYYSQTADMQNAHKIDLGSSQNHRANLGPGTYFWKVNSAYPASPPSTDVYHGGDAPAAVGAGTYIGPPMQLASGSAGFGINAYRNSSTPPVRE